MLDRGKTFQTSDDALTRRATRAPLAERAKPLPLAARGGRLAAGFAAFAEKHKPRAKARRKLWRASNVAAFSAAVSRPQYK
jgi:hypothetical protein